MKEELILEAINHHGGEASGFQIHRRLVEKSRWANSRWWWLLNPSIGGMYVMLGKMERAGEITSRWGQATAERGWRRPRIYNIVKPRT